MRRQSLSEQASRMRRRDLLHTNHLEEFAQFCANAGWVMQLCRGDSEVLRMRKEGVRGMLIVHTRIGRWNPAKPDGRPGFDQPQHLTTWGFSGEMAERFYRTRALAARQKVSLHV